MAEEADPWGFDEGDIQETAPVEAAAAAPAADAAAAPAAADARPEMDVPQDDGHYRKPVTLYKHWVRPRFLQYNYMYDYRHNYYDDVIEYLDKRNRGLKPEVPRAQTWAERVLRTHTRTDDVHKLLAYHKTTNMSVKRSSSFTSRPSTPSSYFESYDSYMLKKGDQPKLIQTLSSSIKPTNYHSRAYISQKYASVL